MTIDIAEALVLSGACDTLAPRMGRRQRLWQLHELWPLIHPARHSSTRTRGSSRRRIAASPASTPLEEIEQLPLAWEDALMLPPPSELPRLPGFDREGRLALDYQLLGLSAGPHPMRLVRRQLRRQGIRTVSELAGVPAGQVARVAGRVISAARPPTANGMGFLVLEDETGRLPVAVPPQLADGLHQLLLKLREARGLVALGRVERVRWYYSLLAYALWTFPTSEGTAAAAN
jgi:error-prone DNA polymerase